MIECIEISLGRKQMELFLNDNLLYMECLVKFDTPRKILNQSYRSLISRNIIPAIETFPVEQKKDLWETAKEYSAQRLDQQKTIELAKALITIEYFLNETP